MPKINTLLLTGANNHDWKRSAPFCQKLLEDSGRFTVTLTENPSQSLEDAASLAKYQLLFVDYNGPQWTDPAKANFESAVQNGAGVVVLHAANNGFPGWTAFEKMAGLMWRQGAGHGEFHEFTVAITDRDHPITRGLPDFKTWDELYHRLSPMHGVDYHVLATAYADPAKKGSGNHEPMMLINQYGKGRVFHQILGHVWKGDPNGAYKGASMIAFENDGFRQSTLRGSEWAATGSVTI